MKNTNSWSQKKNSTHFNIKKFLLQYVTIEFFFSNLTVDWQFVIILMRTVSARESDWILTGCSEQQHRWWYLNAVQHRWNPSFCHTVKRAHNKSTSIFGDGLLHAANVWLYRLLNQMWCCFSRRPLVAAVKEETRHSTEPGPNAKKKDTYVMKWLNQKDISVFPFFSQRCPETTRVPTCLRSRTAGRRRPTSRWCEGLGSPTSVTPATTWWDERPSRVS